MTDDDPVDVARVAADDEAVEQLRARSVRPDDPALELLRDLLADVETDLPSAPKVGRGSTVLRLANESTPDPGLARGGAVVALLTAGVVAFGGVAAASTVVAPGNPLHGLGETVRSAADALVTAVKPPAPQRRADPGAAVLPTPAASRAAQALASRPSAAATPGPEVAAAARSAAAVRQVTALLDEAQQLLDAGRAAVAGQRLDTAERRLADVSAAEAPPLRDRLADLRAQVEAARSAQPAPRPDRPAPASQPGGKPDEPGGKPDEPGQPQPAPQGSERGDSRGKGAAPSDPRTSEPGQPSRLASTKPRA